MATGVVAAGTVIRALAPAINDIYVSSKSALHNRIVSWKLGNNLEKFEKYYTRLSMIKTIWARDEAVPIDSFYYPSRLKKRRKNINTIADLGAACVIIEGIVGQGKSILMRHLVMAELKNSELKALPLFVEFRNVSPKKSLIQLLLDTLNSLGANADNTALEHLLDTNRISLFLDGYDELAPDLIKETNFEITHLQAKYPDLIIIISSRPSTDVQNLPGFTTKALAPLRPTDHQAFLRKLRVDQVRITEIIEAINQSPREIQEAISTPLMLSIVVLVYKSANQIPPYLSEFFDVLFHVVFTQHDNRKDSFRRTHNSGLSEFELQELFEAFCFSVTQKGYGRTLTKTKFNECFSLATERKPNLKTTATKFQEDIVHVSCLLLEEGVGELTFLHKGILDFFTASFASKIKKLSAAEKFYTSASRNYIKWKGALQFLSKIDTYRFNKFYLLCSVHEDWSQFKSIIEQSESEKLIRHLEKIMQDVQFSRTPEGLHVILRAANLSEFDSYCGMKIHNALPEWIYKNTNHATLAESLATTRGATFLANEDGAIDFNLRSILLHLGCERVIESAKAVLEDYEDKFLTARNMIAEEDEQQDNLEMSFD